MSFTDEYATLPAYILGITDRIWEGRGLGLIRRWYAEDCIVRTAFGNSLGVGVVIAGTAETLHSFPDRRLLGEDVIYSGGTAGNGYSSHRIISTMHHRGDGAFGAATGRPVAVRTVADCLIRDGIIVEEWLVRDQAAIALQLGIDPADLGRQRAQLLAVEDRGLPDPDAFTSAAPADEVDSAGTWAARALERIWNQGDLGHIAEIYDPAVNVHLPGGQAAFGHAGMDGWVLSYLAAFADARLVVENIITRTDPGQPTRVALRWRIAATHSGHGAFGPPSGARLHIPGISHLEIVGGKIIREFVLIDELAIWTAVGLQLG